MKTSFGVTLVVFFHLLIMGCSRSMPSTEKAVVEANDSLNAMNENGGWADSAVEDYILHTSNALIGSVRNNTVHVQWMQDTVMRNEVCYKRIQIGIDNDFRFETICWLYLDTAKRIVYEYDLNNDLLVLWRKGTKRPVEVGVENGNIVVLNNTDFGQPLTNKGIDTLPVLSPDGKLVVFQRRTNQVTDSDSQCSMDYALWIYSFATQKEKLIVAPHYAGPPEKDLGNFDNVLFSPNGKYIYFSSCGWAVSAAIHRFDLSNHTEKFISDGNGFTIVQGGIYAGYLIISKHKYYNGGGSYDHNWLITPDGKEVKDIGEEETVQ